MVAEEEAEAHDQGVVLSAEALHTLEEVGRPREGVALPVEQVLR